MDSVWTQPAWKAFQAAPSVKRISADSQSVTPGTVFIAYRGEFADGRQYISQAIERGATAIVYEQDESFRLPENVSRPAWGLPHLREHAGEAAAHLLGHPANAMRCLGVTGTNGKTSITQWLAQALDILGEKCALIGTVGNGFWGALHASTHTTPDAVRIQSLLSEFAQAGAQALALEVSSHGLDQHRVNGVPFSSAIFTNLTRDHLDYHGDMARYGQSKARLFDAPGLRHAIINADDAFGQEFIRTLRARAHLNLVSYGFSQDATVRISAFQAALSGMTLQLDTPWGVHELKSALVGRFNALNLAAAFGLLCAEGFDAARVAQALGRIDSAQGRMQRIAWPGQPLVVVDYAHTPDALENVLKTLQEIKPAAARLWCVMGCGGERDPGKRPLMGQVAQRHADALVVTSDNPRGEDPQTIIDAILTGAPHPEFVNVRRDVAIHHAIFHAKAEDIVLIAGKGHENYQEIQGVKHPFDDAAIALAALKKRAQPKE